MKTIKYKTIKDLLDAVKDGTIDESQLTIQIDNDGVFFGYGKYDKEEYEYETEIEVAEANGQDDTCSLYKLLFPKADVDWV